MQKQNSLAIAELFINLICQDWIEKVEEKLPLFSDSDTRDNSNHALFQELLTNML